MPAFRLSSRQCPVERPGYHIYRTCPADARRLGFSHLFISARRFGGSNVSILLLGASGRVGQEFLHQAKGKGHAITALVRTPLPAGHFGQEVKFIQGQVLEPGVLNRLVANERFAAVVNALGGGLAKSTVVTESTRLAIEALSATEGVRYVGVSVLTLLPVTPAGAATAFFLNSTVLREADRDHGGALKLLQASPLDWTLVACGQIVDGHGGASLQRGDRFTGGYRQIEAGDVAREIWREISTPEHHRTVFGAWA